MSVDLLKVVQNDHQMVPFIYSEVKSVKKSLLSFIVKPSIIEEFKTATDLKNINLSSEENLLSIKDVEMGFGVKNKLKELIKKIMLVLRMLENFVRKADQLSVAS